MQPMSQYKIHLDASDIHMESKFLKCLCKVLMKCEELRMQAALDYVLFSVSGLRFLS